MSPTEVLAIEQAVRDLDAQVQRRVGNCEKALISIQAQLTEALLNKVDKADYEADCQATETRIREAHAVAASAEKTAEERLPLWATWVFVGGGGVIGSLLTLVVMLTTKVFEHI
jgi:hypothetical protein